MVFSFLVTLREGVEMALIVAILLGYLRSVGQKSHFREVWAGVGIAAGACIAIAAGLEVASKQLSSRVVEGFEGFTMIFAVIMLTGMAFWMRRQASGISAELRQHVDSALSRGSMTAMVLLAASSIGREGLETVLFLFAGSTTGGSGFTFVMGGVLGFALAAAIGVGIYHGTSRIPLRPFFLVSGIGVLILAAGLLSNAATKLYAAAIVTNLGPRPWDTDHVISMTSTLGKFLTTLLGYDSAPSLAQIALYWTYLILAVGVFVFIPARKRTSPPRASSAAATAPSIVPPA